MVKLMLGKDVNYRTVILDEENINSTNLFDCGNSAINSFLKFNALESSDNNEAKTYIFLNELENKVIGFFSLRCSAIYCDISVSKEDNKSNTDGGRTINFPAIEIDYFAIDIEYQGLKYDEIDDDELFTLSDALFGDILGICLEVSKIIAFKFLILYSVPNAINFYKKHNFKEFYIFMNRINNMHVEDCMPMFLEI